MSTITSAIQYLALNYARDLVIFTALLLAMSIQCLVVTQVVNHGWRRDIKRHLPTIQRQELQERDTEIQRLAERVEQLRQDNEILTTTVRASASFLGQAREVLTQPEIMRARARRREA